MAYPYNQTLFIGATAGIGRALAGRIAVGGGKVIAVGRRKERLDELVEKCGAEKINTAVFDVSEHGKIPEFASSITTKYPDLDSIFLNAGIQSRHDLKTQFNLDMFTKEIHVNFLSAVAFVHAFSPYLLKKQTPTSIVFTTSNLSYIPSAAMPAYSASKAALNAFILCLRQQLRDTNLKIIELSPPAVQTELHDYMGEEVGRSLGMPLDAFTEEAYKGLTEGKDQIIIGALGPVGPALLEIINKRRTAFETRSGALRKV